MTPIQRRILLACFALLLALLPLIAAEAYLRYLGFGDPIIYYTNNTYRYAPLPNQHKHRRKGAWVTVDATGLRTPEPWGRPADARILFIGNSITWSGTSIDDRETFPYLTCLELEKRTRLSLTCGNAGVSAYGTDNMTARIRYKDFNDEQAIVLTIIYPDMLRGLTELQRNYFFSSSPRGPFRAVWEVGTIALFRLTYWLRHHALVHYGAGTLAAANTIVPEDLSVAEESLHRLFGLLRDHKSEGKFVLVVLSPLKEELGGKESPLTRLAERLLLQYGLEGMNMNRPLTRHLSETTFQEGDDRHLGLDGHRLYASVIADRLAGAFAPRAPR